MTGTAGWAQRTITVTAPSRGCHLITSEITKQVPELRSFKVGMANVFLKHTSASLTINENVRPLSLFRRSSESSDVLLQAAASPRGGHSLCARSFVAIEEFFIPARVVCWRQGERREWNSVLPLQQFLAWERPATHGRESISIRQLQLHGTQPVQARGEGTGSTGYCSWQRLRGARAWWWWCPESMARDTALGYHYHQTPTRFFFARRN